MAIDAGMRSSSSASVLSMMRAWSMTTPGMLRGAEPVAMMTALASSSVSDPSASATPIRRRLRNRPVPAKMSILFLRMRYIVPL
jgi:hypothetical protein